jgi:putative flippase GtrA
VTAAAPAGRRARLRVLGRLPAFAAVGLVNTASYYGCYLLLHDRLQAPYPVAHAVAFLLSMTGAFFLHARFTYRTRPTWRKFALFPLGNVTNAAVTTAGIWLQVDVLGLDSTLAPLPAAAVAVPVTFVLSHSIMTDRPRRPAGAGRGRSPAA